MGLLSSHNIFLDARLTCSFVNAPQRYPSLDKNSACDYVQYTHQDKIEKS